jgi:nucleotide-binding universal stress UspA family protein
MHGIRKSDVVVGIDGSETSTAAAVWAAAEAHRRGVRLVLLYAFVLYAYGSRDSALPGSVPYEEAEIDADQLLAAAAEAVRREYPALTVSTVADHEPAATALLEITGVAALTVIAGQARHKALESLMGSVATYTAEQSTGPVVILRGEASSVPGTGPVVLGVDGSPDSGSAIDFAFEAAQTRQVPLLAVHSWDDSPVHGFRRTFHLHVDEQADTEQLADLTSALAGHTERHPDVTVTPTVRRGHPARVLLQVAAEQGASLLVVGATGLGASGSGESDPESDKDADAGLGGTSRALLAHAEIPVAVVRHRAG